MSLTLTPPPALYTGGKIDITITPDSNVEVFAYTTNNIPPVIAKYIAYDNLSPKNPFIATVEDGRGNILLDGGFPKWYNLQSNPNWTTYAQLSASYKYLYDAIDFISNKTKVASGNKKILIIGDANSGESYNILDSTGNCFRTSLNKILTLKGYTGTYKTRSTYGGTINCTYQELDEYCCVIFFSTVYASNVLITPLAVQSLLAYRENGNGIFFITDHGANSSFPSISSAKNGEGFYKTANQVITNFGCYFVGNYDRSPVNVGYLRQNYGNHKLWENLLDSEYIWAGGSESKVVVTEYPLYTVPQTMTINVDGYHPLRFLIKNKTTGELTSVAYTYGKNVNEIIFFKDENGIDIDSIRTIYKEAFIDFKIDYSSNVSGMLLNESIPVAEFTYTSSTKNLVINWIGGNTNTFKFTKSISVYVQITNPLPYTKNLPITFLQPNGSNRTNSYINSIIDNIENINLYSTTTSRFRKISKFIGDKSSPIKHFVNRFKIKSLKDYYK